MKNKKAQLKIQQMAFMLMAITLFFVLVGMFVLIVSYSGIKNSATALEEKNALLLVTRLANSPEFSCGHGYGGERTNCVDADKLMMLKENIGKYVGFWSNGISNIEIRKIYPSFPNEVLCNVGNYPNCNVIRLYSGEVKGNYLSNFVSLCRKESFEEEVYDKCEVALLQVGYEKVE